MGATGLYIIYITSPMDTYTNDRFGDLSQYGARRIEAYTRISGLALFMRYSVLTLIKVFLGGFGLMELIRLFGFLFDLLQEGLGSFGLGAQFCSFLRLDLSFFGIFK